MIENNRAEFERCRIPEYHAAGRTGADITIAILDDGGKPFSFMDYCQCPLGHKGDGGHATSVARVVHEVAPGARIICLPYTHLSYTEKEKSIKWLLKIRRILLIAAFPAVVLTDK